MPKRKKKGTSWVKLVDQNMVWKPHIVSGEFVEAVIQDLLDRDVEPEAGVSGPSFVKENQADSVQMDMPGMIMVDRRIRHVMVDGLVITVPSTDWENILSRVKLAQARKFSSGHTYYKIHDRFYCIVLSPEQREHMVNDMESQMLDAVKEGDEDRREMEERIRRINDKIGRDIVVTEVNDPTAKRGMN